MRHFLSVFHVCPVHICVLEDTAILANVFHIISSRLTTTGIWWFLAGFLFSVVFKWSRLYWSCSLDRVFLTDWSNPDILVWGKIVKSTGNSVGLWEFSPFCFFWKDLPSSVSSTRSPGMPQQGVSLTMAGLLVAVFLQLFLGDLSLWAENLLVNNKQK